MAARRVARTIMLSSAPSERSQTVRGLEASHIRLGVVQPRKNMETNEEYVPEHLAEMLAAYAKFISWMKPALCMAKDAAKRSGSAITSAFRHICASWRNTVRS